jgi:hypothetical protein
MPKLCKRICCSVKSGKRSLFYPKYGIVMFLRNCDNTYQATRRHVPKASNCVTPRKGWYLASVYENCASDDTNSYEAVLQLEPEQVASVLQAIITLCLLSCGHDPVFCKHVDARSDLTTDQLSQYRLASSSLYRFEFRPGRRLPLLFSYSCIASGQMFGQYLG